MHILLCLWLHMNNNNSIITVQAPSLHWRNTSSCSILSLVLALSHLKHCSCDLQHALVGLSECYERTKGKGSPYSITERRVPELIPVLGSQPAGDVSHKPGGRLPSLSVRPAVILATLKRVATNFVAWWTEARWVWTVCLRLLPDSVAAAIWTQALSSAR